MTAKTTKPGQGREVKRTREGAGCVNGLRVDALTDEALNELMEAVTDEAVRRIAPLGAADLEIDDEALLAEVRELCGDAVPDALARLDAELDEIQCRIELLEKERDALVAER